MNTTNNMIKEYLKEYKRTKSIKRKMELLMIMYFIKFV